MRKRRTKRRRLWLGPIAFAGTAAFCLATNQVVLGSAAGRIYTSTEQIPVRPVALVLGTAPVFNGHPNPFFTRRMDAAAALYRSGKVRKLLVSGDNSRADYDEPGAMRVALISRGIPQADVVVDDAGFRTLDSVVRARRVFGVTECTIVTDDFHLPRALYIATERGIDAVGFQTEPLDRRLAPWTYAREVGARSLVWVDLHVLNRQPKFLGRPETIGL